MTSGVGTSRSGSGSGGALRGRVRAPAVDFDAFYREVMQVKGTEERGMVRKKRHERFQAPSMVPLQQQRHRAKGPRGTMMAIADAAPG